MVFDGDDIWITSPVTGTLYVVRPSALARLPQHHHQERGEIRMSPRLTSLRSMGRCHVMIGGTNNGNVHALPGDYIAACPHRSRRVSPQFVGSPAMAATSPSVMHRIRGRRLFSFKIVGQALPPAHFTRS